MTNEKQTELTEPNWKQYESSGADGNFLKFTDGQTCLVGVKEIKDGKGKFKRKQADGTEREEEVPQLLLICDFVDKPLAAPMVFATSAKYLIATIRKYHESKMLYKWIFEMQRKGMEKQTKYTLIPTKERAAGGNPSPNPSGHPTKSDEIGAFL